MQFDVTYWQPKLYSAVAEQDEVVQVLTDYLAGNPGQLARERAGAVLAELANGSVPSDMGIVARALHHAGFRAPEGTEPDHAEPASDYTAEVRPYPGDETESRGQCEFCTARDVALVAALSGDPDQLVCAVCHADERVPTVALSVLADDRPAWTVTRGDLARLAGRPLTDAEVARLVKTIDNSTAFESVGEAVIQVCGYPLSADDEDC